MGGHLGAASRYAEMQNKSPRRCLSSPLSELGPYQTDASGRGKRTYRGAWRIGKSFLLPYASEFSRAVNEPLSTRRYCANSRLRESGELQLD